MIAFLLNFILIIIFVAFIVVCVVAYRIYRSFHNIKKKFTSKIFSKNEGEYVDFEEEK